MKSNNENNSIWWIRLLIIAAILLVLNTIYAIWGCDNNKSNMLTLISGWVSGIATVFIGVIAFKQNKKYKADSEDSLEKQYQFETAKLVLNNRSSFVQELKTQLKTFLNDYSCYSLIQKVQEIVSLDNPTFKSVQQNHLELEVRFYFETITVQCRRLIEAVNNDTIEGKEKSVVIETLLKYGNECEKSKSFNLNCLKQNVLPEYDKLVETISKYFNELDLDLEHSLKNIRDYTYLVTHYNLN